MEKKYYINSDYKKTWYHRKHTIIYFMQWVCLVVIILFAIGACSVTVHSCSVKINDKLKQPEQIGESIGLYFGKIKKGFDEGVSK